MPFMLSEKDSDVLRDMLFHVHAAEHFAHGQTFESLAIISEASRRLSDELKARWLGIPWREIAAAGNFYRHN
jgi:uncharacterized protein with HEPN domain